MEIISLMKAMALSEESEILFIEAFTEIKYSCDVYGRYDWDSDIHKIILSAINKLREMRKELRNSILENASGEGNNV